MSTIPNTIRNSSINLKTINGSLKDTKRSISSVNDSVNNISRVIANNSRLKKDLYLKDEIIQARRIEAEKRREIEDQQEARNVSFNSNRGRSFTSSLSGGPLSRILGFLGFVTAGWIVENLPTWMFMGKEFVSRIYKVGGSIYRMISNVETLFTFFGESLKNSFNSLVRLDFSNFTEENFKNVFTEINSTMEKLGVNITEIFNIFKTPLTESMDTGEQAPGLGETQPESLFPGIQQEGGSKLTGIHKQALDIISGPESGGDYNAMNRGGAGDSPGGSKKWLGKNLTDMTIGEVMSLHSSGKLYAAGRYQIIPSTLREVALPNSGLKPTDMFNEGNQDRLGMAVLRVQGIGAWTSGGSYYTPQQTAIVNQARRTPIPAAQASSTTQSGSTTQVSPSGTLTGPLTFIQGSTGRSTGPHFHIGPEREVYGKPEGFPAAREGAFLIAKNLMSRRIPFTFYNWHGPNWWYDGKTTKTDAELRDAIAKEQHAHVTRASGSSHAGIDIAAPDGTRIPGIINVQWDGGFGITGRIAGTKAFVGHGAVGSKSAPANSLIGPVTNANTSASTQSSSVAGSTASSTTSRQLTSQGASQSTSSGISGKSPGYSQAVAFGKSLLAMGYKNIWQHPDFNWDKGYTGSGKERVVTRSYDSYHHYGESLDISAYNGEAKLDQLYAILDKDRQKYGIVQLLWRVPGHHDHLHIAFNKLGATLTSAATPAPRPTNSQPPPPQGNSQATVNPLPASQASVTTPAPKIPQITPERQGPNIVLVDTPQQSTSSTPPQTTQQSSQIPPPSTINEFKMLNNFIKNKLLLDLVYL